MEINLSIYNNYRLEEVSFTFFEENDDLLAKKVDAVFQVRIKAFVPLEMDTYQKKIQWLSSNEYPVKIKAGQLIFKEKKSEELERYLRLYKKGTLFLKDARVVTKLQSLTNENARTFTTSSPIDICAANLYIQKLIKEELLRQVKPNLMIVRAEDFPNLQNMSGNKITKKKIFESLLAESLIDDQNRLRQPVGDVSTLISRFGLVSTTKILDVLNCVSFRTLEDSILSRSTQSRVLDPKQLSNMSNGAISIHDASLILSHCIVNEKNKKYTLMNSETGIWVDATRNLVKNSDSFSLSLQFEVDPPEPDDVFESFYILPKELREFILNQVNLFLNFIHNDSLKTTFLEDLQAINFDFFDNWFWGLKGIRERVASEIYKLDKATHKEIVNTFNLELLNEVKQDLKEAEVEENDSELVYRALDIILDERILKFSKSFKNEKKKQKDYDQPLISMEVAIHRKEGAKHAEKLQTLLTEKEHIIRLFLKYSAYDVAIQNYPLNVIWRLDGIEVIDRVELQKTGLASRRVDFADTARPDLTYFGDTNSIFSYWSELKQTHELDDKWLGNALLQLYKTGTYQCDPELKKFIVTLVILLLGKEPAMDRASLLLNYVLLASMKEGITTFEEALELMPMIPQGAVAAKQFLSHIGQIPLDWFARVQSDKDSEKIPHSTYLLQADTFLGSAEKWLQKYDDGITALVRFAVHRISKGKISDSQKVTLKGILESLYGREIPDEDLADALDNEGCLANDTKDIVGDWVIDFAFKKMTKRYLTA